MAAATEGLEKLEDMIVRQAEATGTQVAAAKAAIGAVIFGQEKELISWPQPPMGWKISKT